MIALWSIVGLAALAGLVLGSYAVTAGVRFSRGEASVRGRSHCDACGVVLRFADTIPLVSFARHRGVCSGCREPIDRVHLVGELAGAAVLTGAVLTLSPGRGILIALLGLVLIAIAAVDLKVKRIPDLLSAAVAGLCFLLAATAGGARLLEGAVAGTVLLGCLLALRAAGRRVRGEDGLGLGDVKLLCGLAVWLGVATPIALLLASLLALVGAAKLRDGLGRMAFGPFIAASAWSIGLGLEFGWSPWAL